MVDPRRDVPDELFAALRDDLGEEGVVELGAWVALQNLYSSFNRTFRVQSQGFRGPRNGEGPGPGSRAEQDC